MMIDVVQTSSGIFFRIKYLQSNIMCSLKNKKKSIFLNFIPFFSNFNVVMLLERLLYRKMICNTKNAIKFLHSACHHRRHTQNILNVGQSKRILFSSCLPFLCHSTTNRICRVLNKFEYNSFLC